MLATADLDIVYGMSALGCSSRLVNKPTFTAMGWNPGTRLSLTVPDPGSLLAVPDPEGPVTVMAAWHVRIPSRLRRRVGLFNGDHALLIGHRVHNRLLIHPPAALDRWCATSLLRLTDTDS